MATSFLVGGTGAANYVVIGYLMSIFNDI